MLRPLHSNNLYELRFGCRYFLPRFLSVCLLYICKSFRKLEYLFFKEFKSEHVRGHEISQFLSSGVEKEFFTVFSYL